VALHRAGQADAERVVESFNGRMRDELLNETLFFTIGQARAIVVRWISVAPGAGRTT
jgi:putative transposase